MSGRFDRLLRSVAYPDSSSGSDKVFLTYNRQGQRLSLTDQIGTVHHYEYDGLGRLTEDQVATLGTGVDGAIRRLETTYDERGLVHQLTSFDAATLGSAVNQVQFTYNDFEQSIQTF
jgi:YD repeat-containing protein